MAERVAIIGGTGAIGLALASRLAGAGCEVVIGSRDPGKADQAAADLGAAAARGASNEQAAAEADVVFLCVPFASQATTLKGIAPSLRPGTILVDTTVPLATNVGGKPTRTLGVPDGSAAEQAAALVPEGVTVVAALHTVSAVLLADGDRELDEDTLLCSNDREAIAKVASILSLVPGLRPVDAGRLEQARVAEQMTALMISLNIRHKTHAGVRITGLPDPTER